MVVRRLLSSPRPHILRSMAMSSFEAKHFVNVGKKILGAGLNYKSLIKAKNLPSPTSPVVFLKPTSSYITEGQCIEIPQGFDVHHEVELGVIIGQKCRNLSPCDVMKYVGGYCLALDLTAVDQMTLARSSGLPWTIGKGFDTACPVSEAVDAACLPTPNDVRLWCAVNSDMKQDSSTSDMLFSIEELVSFISKYMTLHPYDLILTGSPCGTGPIKCGDVITAGLGNITQIKFPVQ